GIGEDVATAARERLEADVAVAELAVTARLLLVAALALRRLPDRLTIRNARLFGDHLDVVLALEALHLDFEVQLTEPANDGLAQLRVVAAVEGGILLVQLVEGAADLVLVAAAGCTHGERDVGLGEVD